jgi:hypothetical protein
MRVYKQALILIVITLSYLIHSLIHLYIIYYPRGYLTHKPDLVIKLVSEQVSIWLLANPIVLEFL